MNTFIEAVIYTVLIFGGGFMGGHWLTLSWYERRYKYAIRRQHMREERLKEMDAEDVESVERMAELARMQ